MKRNFTKVVLVLLAVIMAVLVFVACDDNTQTFSVTIKDGETTLATYKVTDGVLPDYSAKVVKDNYVFKGLYIDKDLTKEFNEDAVIAANLTLYAKFEKVTYTIMVNANGGSAVQDVTVSYGDAFTIPEPEREGYEFLGYTYLNDEEVATAFDFETYPFKKHIRVTAKWKRLGGISLDEETATTYFKERASESDPYTYIFLTGRTYDFGDAVISTTDGYEYVSLRSVNGVNDQFSANKATPADSTFSLTVTPVDGAAKTIKARVVESVNSFGVGADFNAMIANATEEKGLFKVATTNADYVMDIGNNNFIPDISIKNLKNETISLAAANVKVMLGDLDVTASLEGNVLNLAAELISGEVKTLTFTPKYALAADNIASISLKVKVNGGVNVYTNEELMSQYANTGVQCINVMRNIKAVLPAGEYYSDYGKVGDIVLDDGAHVLKDWDLGVPHNWYGGGVYRRTTNDQSDRITINGNYFTIDGSKLPYVNDKSSRTTGAGSELMEPQIGIFMYRCAEIDYTGNKRDINIRYAGGTANINNLRIVSNASPDLAGSFEAIPDSDNGLLKMSASFIGIVCRGGTLNLENTTLANTSWGFMLDGGVSGYGNDGIFKPGGAENWVYDANETQSVHLNMNNSKIMNSWSFDIYAYNLCAVNLTNTILGNCNGAAICFDDKAYAPNGGDFDGTNGYSNLNSALNMDLYTAKNIKNWVYGSEAWFVAYGTAGYAAQIKTDMQKGVSANGLTIIKETDAGQMFNFAILVNNGGGTWASDKDGKSAIDFNIIDAMTIDANNHFVFSYGNAEEYATIGGLLGQGNIPGAVVTGQGFVWTYVPPLNMNLYVPAYVPGMQ